MELKLFRINVEIMNESDKRKEKEEVEEKQD